MLGNPKPDREEKVIRFLFGAFAGTVVGGIVFFQLQWGPHLLVTSLLALIFGVGAMRFGDDFWCAFSTLGQWVEGWPIVRLVLAVVCSLFGG